MTSETPRSQEQVWSRNIFCVPKSFDFEVQILQSKIIWKITIKYKKNVHADVLCLKIVNRGDSLWFEKDRNLKPGPKFLRGNRKCCERALLIGGAVFS